MVLLQQQQQITVDEPEQYRQLLLKLGWTENELTVAKAKAKDDFSEACKSLLRDNTMGTNDEEAPWEDEGSNTSPSSSIILMIHPCFES